MHEEACGNQPFRCLQTKSHKCPFYGHLSQFLTEHIAQANCFNYLLEVDWNSESDIREQGQSTYKLHVMDITCTCSSQNCDHSIFKITKDFYWKPKILVSRSGPNFALITLFVTRTISGYWYITTTAKTSDSLIKRIRLTTVIKKPETKKTSNEDLPLHSLTSHADLYNFNYEEVLYYLYVRFAYAILICVILPQYNFNTTGICWEKHHRFNRPSRSTNGVQKRHF